MHIVSEMYNNYLYFRMYKRIKGIYKKDTYKFAREKSDERREFSRMI